jgi:hypothetical protein
MAACYHSSPARRRVFGQQCKAPAGTTCAVCAPKSTITSIERMPRACGTFRLCTFLYDPRCNAALKKASCNCRGYPALGRQKVLTSECKSIRHRSMQLLGAGDPEYSSTVAPFTPFNTHEQRTKPATVPSRQLVSRRYPCERREVPCGLQKVPAAREESWR